MIPEFLGTKMNNHPKVAAVITAAGFSERMGDIDKVFAPLDGRSILARVVDVFQGCELIGIGGEPGKSGEVPAVGG